MAAAARGAAAGADGARRRCREMGPIHPCEEGAAACRGWAHIELEQGRLTAIHLCTALAILLSPLPRPGCNIPKIYQIKSHAKKIIFKILFVVELNPSYPSPISPKPFPDPTPESDHCPVSLFLLAPRASSDRTSQHACPTPPQSSPKYPPSLSFSLSFSFSFSFSISFSLFFFLLLYRLITPIKGLLAQPASTTNHHRRPSSSPASPTPPPRATPPASACARGAATTRHLGPR